MTSLPVSTNHRHVCCTVSTGPTPIFWLTNQKGMVTEELRRVSLAKLSAREIELTNKPVYLHLLY